MTAVVRVPCTITYAGLRRGRSGLFVSLILVSRDLASQVSVSAELPVDAVGVERIAGLMRGIGAAALDECSDRDVVALCRPFSRYEAPRVVAIVTLDASGVETDTIPVEDQEAP